MRIPEIRVFQDGPPPIQEGALYVFDFDGVLCTCLEHEITLLPFLEGEEALIHKANAHYGIRCQQMSINYQRHLAYQAAAMTLGMPLETGPALEFAKQISQTHPWFILTARSGWHGVMRMLQYLDAQALQPTEIFGIGRVPKDRQFGILLGEHAGAPVYYCDDTLGHLEHVQTTEYAPRVQCYHVLNHCPPGSLDKAGLRRQFEDVVTAALQKEEVGR